MAHRDLRCPLGCTNLLRNVSNVIVLSARIALNADNAAIDVSLPRAGFGIQIIRS